MVQLLQCGSGPAFPSSSLLLTSQFSVHLTHTHFTFILELMN